MYVNDKMFPAVNKFWRYNSHITDLLMMMMMMMMMMMEVIIMMIMLTMSINSH